ncbi:MAG: ABC transporter permease [Selenomonadaceae bacterium]|nr:ABC transporter permease [Selenomonadaceae bacterium]
MNKKQAISVSLIAIAASLLAGAILLLILGKDPIAAYTHLLQGSGLLPKAAYAAHRGMFTDFMKFLTAMAPMLLAALAFAVALRGGMFNISIAGQMLAAGFTASLFIGYSSLPALIARPLAVTLGLITGGAIGAFIGWLKHRFNVNEVVSSIMVNYSLMYGISFAINALCLDPVSRQSVRVGEAARLTLRNIPLGDYITDISLGILLALAAAALVHIYMTRSIAGFSARIAGLSPTAARYAGIDLCRHYTGTMAFSGALAGLAGVCYYMGYYASIQMKVMPSMGFDAIAVSLLGCNNPLGIIGASFLITILNKGSIYMSAMSGVDMEIASLIIGTMLIFSACTAYMGQKLYGKNKGKETAK